MHVSDHATKVALGRGIIVELATLFAYSVSEQNEPLDFE